MIYVPTYGGASKANRLLLEGFAAKGHQCRVVAPAFGAQVSVKTQAEFFSALDARGIRVTSSSAGVAVFEYHGVEVHAVTDISRLHDYVVNQSRKFAPTWTLVSNDDPGQLMLEAALAANPSNVVYVVHTPQALPFGPKGFLTDEAQTRLVRQTAGMITESHYVRDYIKQWSGLEAVAIPFPIYGPGPFPDLGRFDEGYVTLINPCAVKGISIFLELARRMPDFRFAGVPTWGTTKVDRAAMEQLPNIEVLPPVDHIEEIFRRTRVLLMPSLWTESFPLTVREAMLHGIPVVGSDSGGLRETMLGMDYVIPVRLIERYEERFDELGNPIPVVPEQDVEVWERTLRKLLTDRALYEQLSAESREAAVRFVAGVSVAPFEDYLENLAPRPQMNQAGAAGQAQPRDSRLDLEAAEAGAAGAGAAALANLSPERLELLARRLRKAGGEKTRKTIPRRSASGPAPLSFSQQRLWFMDQLEPGNPVYGMPWQFVLTGPLDVARLEQSFNEVIKRHEVLRTNFVSADGNAVQVVAPVLRIELPVTDLSGLPDDEREAAALRLAVEDARRPFNLAEGPLLRAGLLRLDEEEHMLLLNIHHIIYDLWSMNVLFRELAAHYEALAAGQPASLPELPIQFADYAVWQREHLTGEVYAEQLAYWKKQLDDAPGLLDLPADRPRPPVQTFRGAKETVLFPKRLNEGLQALSQQEGVTTFMTLLAAFQTLLARYSGQDDIVVGSPIAGRTRDELEGSIGFFVNNLVLRTGMSGDPTFRELVMRVKNVTLGAYAHQDFPFEKIVEELHPERSLSHTPLFQVMFALQSALTTRPPELPGLNLRQLQVEEGISKFDLTLYMIEEAEGLRARLEYNSDLFDAATVRRILGHLQVLLEAVVADPDQRLSALPLLTAAERHQLLVEWNDTRTEFPKDSCLHELFERQAEKQPDAIAAFFEDKVLTYGELNRRANQLAHHLQGLGVGPDVPVGICVGRSFEMVIGLVGILKAGGAYLPLDPAYPRERLAFMIKDTAAPVLLTQRHLVETLPEDSTAAVVCLDADWEMIAREPKENPRAGVTPENLSYVIYTSGSTGKPKGIAIRHRGVVNNITDLNRSFAVGPRDRVLALSSLSFDMCVYEVFGTLESGGAIVLPAPATERDPAHWAELIVRHGVTVWNSAPSLLEMLVEQTSDRPEMHPRSLRLALLGGDWVPVTLPDRLKALAPGVRVIVMGGATEASIHSIIYEVRETDPTWKSIPYGRPMANQLAHILDGRLQPAPIGVPGELHLGGTGLARGYFNRPELTAEKFIRSPFGADAGERLYKTGDLARYLADGQIELLGRMDFQVKIRGFRIELGEIIAALRQHRGVEDAVAVVREDEPGNRRLVAYVVPAGDSPPSVTELRNSLKQTLPEYMVPTAFVMLDKLPLSPNGKVDRRALAAPDIARPELEEAFVSPRTAVEEVVAGIWAAVLGVERVGVEDNFFELGGHSLLATQVVSRIQEAFQMELPLRYLFEWPTVAGLAESLGRAGGGANRVAPEHLEKIARVLIRLNQLSEEEAKTMLAEKSQRQLELVEE